MADAGRCLKNDSYIKAADAAATFVLTNLRRDGRLLRTHTAGEAKLNAYIEDYALLVDGLIALHQATGEARYLQEADSLTTKQIELFWDEKNGGFFFTSADHEELIAKLKDVFDGPLPSSNAVAARKDDRSEGRVRGVHHKVGRAVILLDVWRLILPSQSDVQCQFRC